MHSETIHPDVTKTIVIAASEPGSTSNHSATPLTAVIAISPKKMGLIPRAPLNETSGFRRSARSCREWTPASTGMSGPAPVCRCLLRS